MAQCLFLFGVAPSASNVSPSAIVWLPYTRISIRLTSPRVALSLDPGKVLVQNTLFDSGPRKCLLSHPSHHRLQASHGVCRSLVLPLADLRHDPSHCTRLSYSLIPAVTPLLLVQRAQTRSISPSSRPMAKTTRPPLCCFTS
jgi:hypothetical protein